MTKIWAACAQRCAVGIAAATIAAMAALPCEAASRACVSTITRRGTNTPSKTWKTTRLRCVAVVTRWAGLPNRNRGEGLSLSPFLKQITEGDFI